LFFSFFLFVWRYLVTGLTSLHWLREKILFVGFQPEVKELLSLSSFQNNYKVVAFFLPLAYQEKERELQDYRIVYDLNGLKELVEKKGVDSLVLVPGFKENNDLLKKIFSFFALRVKYLNFADLYETLSHKVLVRNIDNVWLMENLSPIDRKIDQIVKRIFDLVFSLLGLLLFAPMFPFLALAIKLDSPGPIIYSQKRVGKKGKVFVLYKLRTMVADAEKWGPRWAKPDDPRITRAGRILRKTHLDELPQLFNILKGEMSFVGPRPERPAFVDQLKQEIPYYDIRHLVKPGFTGWAQINYGYGASVKDAEEKLKYELYYIKNRFVFLDLGIILKTLRIIFKD
jgi:exopolysaccharide biosynthesis polyprenyl glycosylphosphotransferase